MHLSALLLAASLFAVLSRTGTVCLRVEDATGRGVWRPIAAGADVRLRFHHSLWGSLVEEDFRVAADGLELVRLRYAEARLAEYYGHDVARREGDWWVVEGDGRRLRTLTLRGSPESELELLVGSERIALWDQVEPGRAIRLTVTACDGR